MGLVQHFWSSPYPPLLARVLLDQALADWQAAGYQWELHLSRFQAQQYGTTAEVEMLDAQLEEHLQREQILRRWNLDYLFSDEGYTDFGGAIFSCWALVLIRLCQQSERWSDDLLAVPVPYKLPGFKPTAQVWSTDWLDEFRYAFHRELKDVYPQLGRWLQ